MSSWGLSNFESETSGNFITDLEINGYGLIAIAFDRIISENERPDVTECEEALIAAEIVAAVTGHPAHDFPDDAAAWIMNTLPPGSEENILVLGLADHAADVIDKIVADSELRDLWEDSPDFDSWFQAQVALQKRILE